MCGVIEGCGLQRIVRNHPPIEYLSCDHINVSVDAKHLYALATELILMTETTNVQVTWETHARLSAIGRKGETFNHIVERLLDSYEVRK
jgi:hypothetical protein